MPWPCKRRRTESCSPPFTQPLGKRLCQAFSHISAARRLLRFPGESQGALLRSGRRVDTTLDTHWKYDTAGQIVWKQDPLLNITTYGYDPATDSCLNSVTYPTPSSGVALSTSQVCDFNTGLVTSAKDLNGVTTSYTYDSMLHLTGATAALGSSLVSQVTYAYSGSTLPETVTTTVKATPDPDQVTTVTLDSLGRTSSTVGANGATVATIYDAEGRVQSVTNPYRSTSDATYGITSYSYDALGRKTYECEPDNTSSPSTTCTPTNSYQSWSYSGGQTVYQDENRHQWTRTADALGRLTQVLEPNPADGADTLETDYQYDALSNLTQVDEWGGYNPATGANASTCLLPNGAPASGGNCDRIRRFSYDSVSRLVTATNPESGTVGYTYDSNSNVHTKTAANGVVTTYSYDGLNRLTGKSYTDGTPSVSYSYDSPLKGWNFVDQASPVWSGVQQTNLAGRLSYESTAGSTIVYGYDPAGRTTLKSECTPSTCGTDHFDMHAAYDAAGNPTFVDRGLDAVMNAASPNAGYYYGGLSMAYNSAGQLTSATSDISDTAHPANLLQNLSYTPAGQEQTAELASAYGQISQYDNRNRRTTRYSGNLAGQVVLGDSWSYDKVGNVTSAVDSQQGGFSYIYDTLNRVTQGTFGNTTMNYGYDPWGNQTSHTLSQGSSYQWSFMPTTQNRATVPGSVYDASGNMLADGRHQYTYNAEGQIASVTDQNVFYQYDPEGKRIATFMGGTGAASEKAEYLSDIKGNLVTTLNPNHTMVRSILRDNLGVHRGDYVAGPQGGAGKTEIRLVNQVGTLLANADTEGNFVEGCLSGPFGDGQLCSSSYDYTETHFTDKLRDQESNNDYFGARYFNSTLGRYTSPDPSGLSYADPANPQSLNAYTYVQNNPLSFVDPTGLALQVICTPGKEIVYNSLLPDGEPVTNDNVGDTQCTTYDDGTGNYNGFLKQIQLMRYDFSRTAPNGFLAALQRIYNSGCVGSAVKGNAASLSLDAAGVLLAASPVGPEAKIIGAIALGVTATVVGATDADPATTKGRLATLGAVANTVGIQTAPLELAHEVAQFGKGAGKVLTGVGVGADLATVGVDIKTCLSKQQ